MYVNNIEWDETFCKGNSLVRVWKTSKSIIGGLGSYTLYDKIYYSFNRFKFSGALDDRRWKKIRFRARVLHDGAGEFVVAPPSVMRIYYIIIVFNSFFNHDRVRPYTAKSRMLLNNCPLLLLLLLLL